MTRSLSDLTGKNVVIYDLEIKKTIEQCTRGWASLDEMGISVGCLYDYRSSRYRIFMDDNLQELVDRLNEPNTLVVAFNHLQFDNQLLRASGYALKPDVDLLHYDMLVVSRAGAGASKFAKGFRLDDHLQALGLPMKTGAGAMAPIWWQEGKIGTVIDYCLQDVYAEKQLFENMYVHGKTACLGRTEFYNIEAPNIVEFAE